MHQICHGQKVFSLTENGEEILPAVHGSGALPGPVSARTTAASCWR
jgi:hypothetical protein